ncbi:CUE domain-containing protein 2 [Trichonephila clavata]|uniref:CUE domain-containing protein 2 n=1 Tax=Trichonephila clavata TaxID=2740835 RepID=A0A8X6J919_TRICU|nr:CUE domain-containing protein 2 [Trichonephila clavata]
MEHTGLDALSSIDEIVLSYIIGVLETLGCADSPEDVFDVDEFAEMMTAYIPAFSNIHSSHTYAWMLNLAGWLKEESRKNDKNEIGLAEGNLFKTHERQRTVSESSNPGSVSGRCQHIRLRRKSYQSTNSYSSSQSEDDEKCITVSFESGELETLLEMFPHLHVMEVKQFLSVADGDCEKAVQLILQKEETGFVANKPLTSINNAPQHISNCKEKFVEDKQLREQILKRYAYIDQDEDVREHKPVAPRTEPKKLIRYRDNKIVSIKGERYSEVKKTEESGDPK